MTNVELCALVKKASKRVEQIKRELDKRDAVIREYLTGQYWS